MRTNVADDVVTNLPAAAGAAGMVLFGIPQGVLIAAFIGAVISFYFRTGTREQRIPVVIFGVIAIAVAGAWASMALPYIEFLGIGSTASKVDPAARAGLTALAFQSIWNFGHRWTDRKVEGTS